MIDGSKKVAARATSRYADITTATPAAATAAAGVPLPGSGALGSLAVRSAPTGSAAARQHTAAMRFSLPGATHAAQARHHRQVETAWPGAHAR